MKKKKNPIVIAIVILLIVLIAIIYMYISPSGTENESAQSTDTAQNVDSAVSSLQTIENTLSNSGQINSALDEKLYLYASYYFEELLVEENVLVKEGEYIVEYTNETYLKAPYDCVVVSTNLPIQDEICTASHYVEVQSIDTLCMNLSVSETDINKIEIGDAVDISITASGEKLEGYITSISEVGTYSSSGSYFTAVVTFENNGNLKIGMSATCEIIIESAENVVAVPVEAIQEADSGKYVVVINQDGTTENVNVETGISNDAYIEIKSGLSEGKAVQVVSSEDSSSSGMQMMNMRGNRSSGGNFDMPSGGGNMPSGMPSGGFSGSMPNMPNM